MSLFQPGRTWGLHTQDVNINEKILACLTLLVITSCTDDDTDSETQDSTETGDPAGDGDGDMGDGDGDGAGNTDMGDGDGGDGDGDGGDGDGDGGDGDGDGGDGDGDGGDGDGDVGDGDGDVGDGDGDVGDGDGDVGDGDGDAEPAVPWLLSYRNDTKQLVKISTVDATQVPICTIEPSLGNYPSTTFGFDGTLYGSNAGMMTLDIIDPCTCEVEVRGPTNFGSIPGITANGNELELLYGVSTTEDVLLTLNTLNGAGTEIGGLGVDFGFSGTSWSAELGGLYAVNNLDDTLYELNTGSGMAEPVAVMDIDVGSVGIEWHPQTEELYVCSNTVQPAGLYRVNTQDGTTELIGMLEHNCNNLAAPWVAVECVDDIPL